MKRILILLAKTAVLFLLCCYVIVAVVAYTGQYDGALNNALGMVLTLCFGLCALDEL